MSSHHPCQTGAHYLYILTQFQCWTPPKVFLTFSIRYSIKIILLGWWKWSSKRMTAQPHSTCMNGFLPAHLKAFKWFKRSQESFKLFRTSPSCKGTLEHVHARDYSISSWMSLLEKLINPSLMLFTLPNVVQHSKQNTHRGAKQYDRVPQRGRNS